jgi:hypothetical protein
MKGFLMLKKQVIPGEEVFLESHSPENRYGIVFEDNGETGYFYAVETIPDQGQGEIRILDALHIYDSLERKKEGAPLGIEVIWSRDWLKCALILGGACHAVFDFENQGGYCINEFPPPNETWTRHGRTLTNQLIRDIF